MRKLHDDNLLEWEVYASSGDFGLATPARIMFLCLSDRSIRPRFVEDRWDKAAAEETVVRASDAELRELLDRSQEID